MLWRGMTQLQIGTDPRWSIALSDLSPAAARCLAGLPAGSDLRVLRSRLTAAGSGAEEIEAIVGHLGRAALLVEPTAPRPTTPDALAWSLVDGPGAGPAARDRFVVRVEGLGRLGLRVAAALATAGVGALDLVDPGGVTVGDVEAGGYRAQDVGAPRVSAAARVLHDAVPRLRLVRPVRPPALVVLVERHVADPVRHRELLGEDVPHLSVLVREASALVGPLVRPGRGPCLRCVELHRADADERWPAVAAQLVATRTPLVGGEEVTVAAIASGLAAAHVLAYLDGRGDMPLGTAEEVRVPDVLPRRLTWGTHPECGCTAPPAGNAGERTAHGRRAATGPAMSATAAVQPARA